VNGSCRAFDQVIGKAIESNLPGKGGSGSESKRGKSSGTLQKEKEQRKRKKETQHPSSRRLSDLADHSTTKIQ